MGNSTKSIQVRQPGTLAVLAEEINDLHRQAEAMAGKALDLARQAGERLLEAKVACPHGTWRDWLKTNFAGSERTAQRYMSFAKRWPELMAKTTRVADLPIREAAQLLAEPKPIESEAGDYFEQMTPEDRHKHCMLWWDLFANHVLIYSMIGWGEEEIADYCSMPIEDVSRVLHPVLPVRSRHQPCGEFGNDQFYADYNDAVQHVIAGIMAVQHKKAAWAAERWGHANLSEILTNRSRALQARQNRLEQNLYNACTAMEACGTDDAERRALFCAVYATITADARKTLGIESAEFEASLLFSILDKKSAIAEWLADNPDRELEGAA